MLNKLAPGDLNRRGPMARPALIHGPKDDAGKTLADAAAAAARASAEGGGQGRTASVLNVLLRLAAVQDRAPSRLVFTRAASR